MRASGVFPADLAQTSRLWQFQNDFASALFGTDPVSRDIAELLAQPGFAVYRNTVLKGCVDALQDNFPSVSRLVGDQWFRGAAQRYALQHLPQAPSLLLYGEDFAEFLAAFEPARALPYLCGVACLDRYWIEAHIASDAPCIDASAITALPLDALARTTLHPHPSARWRWFSEGPVFTLWCQEREQPPAQHRPELVWAAEGALVLRPQQAVRWEPLDRAGCAFLDACAGGATLAEAAAAALESDPQAELDSLMARLLGAGAFSGVLTR